MFVTTKIHGCKNDYIFFDFIWSGEKPPKGFSPAKAAKALSPRDGRAGSIGADGIILLLPSQSPAALAEMRIFNADGSEAEMCGNGLRGTVKYVAEKLLTSGVDRKDYPIATLSGLRTGQVIEKESAERWLIRTDMGRPSFLPNKIPVLFDDVMVMNEEFEVDGRLFRVSCVSMGNPHCVIEVEDLESFPVAHFGPLFEKHEVFPQGTNVEFIELKDGKVFQRTWERGSGETMACGTGACAVGVALMMHRKFQKKVDIHLKGGILSVEWDGLREVYLTGEAVTEGQYSVNINDFVQ